MTAFLFFVFVFCEYIKLYDDETYTCNCMKEATMHHIAREEEGIYYENTTGTHWNGGVGLYGGHISGDGNATGFNGVGYGRFGDSINGSGDGPYGGGFGSFEGISNGNGLGGHLGGPCAYAVGITPVTGSTAASSTNWNFELRADGEVIIHNPSDTTIWTISGSGSIVLAEIHGGINQSFVFKEVSPDKYQITTNDGLCVEYIPKENRLKCKFCHTYPFQMWTIIDDVYRADCSTGESNPFMIRPQTG
ncbi:hypothetical protein NAPIS_ORF02624 [Vairimorpha apis BRL 01]|uniref:Uncharacterized protein n=2 Tax=Vairimorpha apis BRL 01 TaxID=1037528 RepID=T0M8N2_9MICR|nr:hypothetical protein NAPIS_ORF02624 [Vairimorpha apis BRL 01]